jgi:hypothetical protein
MPGTANRRRLVGVGVRQILAGNAFLRGLEVGRVGRRQGMGRGNVRCSFTAMFGGEATERLDHGGNREQAAIVCDDAQEISGETGDLRLVGDGRDGTGLIFAGKYRAFDQTPKIGAIGEHFFKAVQIGLDLSDRFGLLREGEQRTRIAFCDTRNWR